VTWTRDVLNLPAQLVSGMILTMLKVHIISESSAKKIYERGHSITARNSPASRNQISA
jgi:hypothetical protein